SAALAGSAGVATSGGAAGASPTGAAGTLGSAGGVSNAGGAGSGAAGSNQAGRGGAGPASGGAATGGAATGGAATGTGGAAGGASSSAGAGSGSAGAGGSSGGSAGSGSGGATGGACSRPIGACTSPAVTITSVNLGVAVTGYGSQADTAALPMAISALPSGGSRLAWLGTDKKVYIAELDCSDQLVGTPFSFAAEDLQDLYADDNGGVVMLVRNATNSGTDNCGAGALCGGTSSQCQNTWLVRFDKTGKVVWETQVTNLSSTLAGYDDGAIFTWKNYQHHGRIAFDGANYAAYFSAAITVYRTGNSGCIDIHEGDRMQAVDATGKLVTGHNSFPWGCSHSWTTRILFDPGSKAFVMTCATDANNCAIKRPDTGALLFQATCSGQFFNGDLINSNDGGYWSAWSDSNAIRLNHFTFSNVKGASVANAGASQHPHLVPYGPSNMLVAWGSGTSMAAQVRSMSAGDSIGAQFSVNVKDHVYQAFKPYADGSAAYPAVGDTSTSVKIARVMPCQ
ncbi:MAG: hypothetical protein ABW061_08485, partial [Polyangiaceae bacterium]